MEAIILGSGTGVPSLRRGSPGLALTLEQETLLFDIGSGTLLRLLRAGINPYALRYVLLTHFHTDHSADLAPLLFALSATPGHLRTEPLHLVGPKGAKAFMVRLLDLYPSCVPKFFKLEVLEAGEATVNLDRRFKVWARPVAHSGAAVGYRVEAEGKVFAYSGDTGPCKGILELGQQADLLALECSFPDDQGMEGHLTPSLAGEIAREARAKRLVLTHLYPACDAVDVIAQCRKVYDGEIILAEDMIRVPIL